ncbi:MAG: hypothetical protein HC824_08850 [Synechococcales cyanobacterium RM1_1_8]|nr:hypothetical protein [Synechococcales cyanobacterium RM1_1_8]
MLTFAHPSAFWPRFLWLPLPGSNADLAASVFFLGIVGIIVWQIYYSTEK